MGGRQRLLYVIIGCVVVLAGVMVLAVVLNRGEAREFAHDGIRATARVTDKSTWQERVARTTQEHRCLEVEVEMADGRPRRGSSCDRGIDQIFDRVQVGDSIRIVYLRKDVAADGLRDYMLEAWADGELSSI